MANDSIVFFSGGELVRYEGVSPHRTMEDELNAAWAEAAGREAPVITQAMLDVVVEALLRFEHGADDPQQSARAMLHALFEAAR